MISTMSLWGFSVSPETTWAGPTENVMNGDQHISLTPIEARFLTEYLIDFDTKAAAIRAGYDKKTAKIKGHVLLQIPTIKAAIARAVETRDGPRGEGSAVARRGD